MVYADVFQRHWAPIAFGVLAGTAITSPHPETSFRCAGNHAWRPPQWSRATSPRGVTAQPDAR